MSKRKDSYFFLRALRRIFDWLIDPFYGKEQNPQVAIACLLIATAFWFVHKLNQNYNTRLAYPIEFSYDSTHYMPLRELPQQLALNVGGHGWDLLKRSLGFGMQPIVIKPKGLPKSNFISSRRLFSMLEEEIGGLELNFLEVDTLRFYFDTIVEKRLHLAIVAEQINMADGVRMSGEPIRLSPDTILVRGAKSLVESLPDTYYVALDSNMSVGHNFNRSVPLHTDTLVGIACPVESVKLTVPTKQYIKRVIQLRPQLRNMPAGKAVTLVDTLVKVIFKLDKDRASEAPKQPVNVVADFNLLDSAQREIPLLLHNNFPQQAYDIEVNPSRVRVVVKPKSGN